MINFDKIDKSKFINSPFVLRVEKPWGYEFIFTQPDLPYAGKILHIGAGKRLSLQIHEAKKESCFLISGRCNLIVEDTKGDLETIEIEQGKGYTIEVGQKHRYQAITDCDVCEVSTPETGTTYRIEDDYGRSDETQEIRVQDRINL